jgi:hypothetical protein
MPTLIIMDEDEAELLRVQIKQIDPATATIAILKALDAIPEPRKPRSDTGTHRRKPVLPPAARTEIPDPALS